LFTKKTSFHKRFMAKIGINIGNSDKEKKNERERKEKKERKKEQKILGNRNKVPKRKK